MLASSCVYSLREIRTYSISLVSRVLNLAEIALGRCVRDVNRALVLTNHRQ